MSAPRYLWTLAAGLAGFFAVAAVVAVALDPFGIFSSEERIRPARNDNDRLIKPFDPVVRPARVIFAGTSRTKQGLDPAELARDAGVLVYNAGIDGGPLAESAALARFHARYVRGLRHVYLELFPVGNLLSTNTSNVGPQPSDLLRLILSGSAQLAAFRMIFPQEATQPYTHLSGFGPASYPCAKCTFDAFLDQAHWRKPAMDFELEADLAPFLKRLRDDAAAHGVELRYYLPPLHSWVAYSYFARGSWQALEALKLQLAGVGGVHDFLRFDEFTDEPPATQMRYWLEAWHYSPELGERMALPMMGNRPVASRGFGSELSPATVQEELAAWRAERDAWSARNPAVVARFRAK
jgi:hypothetical protein